MMTQTHAILGLALFAKRAWHRGFTATETRWIGLAALMGALVPDMDVWLMFGIGKLQGIPEHIIFGEHYFQDPWRTIQALTNSIPLYAGLTGISGYLLWQHTGPRKTLWLNGAFAFGGSSLAHVVTDFFLHADDGRPQLWPFSDFIFQSPVSYWDPAFHGDTVRIVECLFGLLLCLILMRRFERWVTRGLLLLLVVGYVGLMGIDIPYV